MMGATSVGYKSSQCNTLYYDPAQTYPRPKMYDGSLFPLQLVRRGPLRRIRQFPRGSRPARSRT